MTLGGLIGSSARAGPNGLQDREPQDSKPQDLEADSGPIQLFVNLFTRVGAAVYINGRGPFVFIIDTGAGTTSVADTVADQLGLPAGDPMLVHGLTSAAVTRSVEVDRLRLNGLEFDNLRCPVFPRGQLGADGLLGLDVLGRFRLSFDVKNRTASLAVRGIRIIVGRDGRIGSLFQRDGMRSVRGRFGQLILTRVMVDGQSTAAFVDSGAQYSIGNQALRRAIETRRPMGARPPRSIPLYGVTGQSTNADLLRVDDVRMSTTHLGPTSLLFADLHSFEILGLADRPALLIGADLLSRFSEVSLDFPSNVARFTGLLPPRTQTLDLLLR